MRSEASAQSEVRLLYLPSLHLALCKTNIVPTVFADSAVAANQSKIREREKVK